MAIIYEGPSQLDGQPIVAILTGVSTKSENPKTGPMAQTWILRSDMHPIDALKEGEDSSICGTCPLRAGACYVTVGLGPATVYRSFLKGRYPVTTPALASLGLASAKRAVRLGAYGDPTAVPYEIWSDLLAFGASHTGYTHQWRTCDRRFKRILMASCDTLEERWEARVMGWRTFRVKTPDQPVEHREMVCPASAEGGHKLQCWQCLQCNGGLIITPRDVVINAHGSHNKADIFAALTRKHADVQ